jgi:hypothetical protein
MANVKESAKKSAIQTGAGSEFLLGALSSGPHANQAGILLSEAR